MLSFLLNGAEGFSLGVSHLLSKMFILGLFGKLKKVPTKKNYNKACDKITPAIINELVKKSYRLEADEKEETFHGLTVLITDGTHVILPRTEETLKKYSLGSGSKGDAYYPQTTSVGYYNLSTGLFEELVSKNIKTPERQFMQEHAQNNNKPTLYLADAGYNGMGHIAIMKNIYNQDILMQLKMGTAFATKFMHSKKRSKIFTITITYVHLRNYPQFKYLKGKQVKIRLIRTRGTSKLKSQILITTLLDEKKFTWEKLVLLYLQRYKIELAFRHLKTKIKLEKIKKQKLHRIEQLLEVAVLLFNISVMLRNIVKQNSLLPEKRGVKVYCLIFTTNLVPKLIASFINNKFIRILKNCIIAIKSCFSINRPWRIAARICQFPCSTFTRQKTSRNNSELTKVVFLTPEYEILGNEYGML
jgi:hypothetical protein